MQAEPEIAFARAAKQEAVVLLGRYGRRRSFDEAAASGGGSEAAASATMTGARGCKAAGARAEKPVASASWSSSAATTALS